MGIPSKVDSLYKLDTNKAGPEVCAGTPPKWTVCEEEEEVLMISLLRGILPQAFPVLTKPDKWTRKHQSGISKCETVNLGKLKPGTPEAQRREKEIIQKRGGHLTRKIQQGGTEVILKQKATDIYLRASNADEKRLGDLLFQYFVANRAQLGIQQVIWNKQSSFGELVGVYPRSKARKEECDAKGYPWDKISCLHQDHLHVEFDREEGDKDHSCMLRYIVAKVKDALDGQTV